MLMAGASSLTQCADFSLGAVRVSPARRVLDGLRGPVAVEPLVMTLLFELSRNAGRVVSRSMLLEAVWEVTADIATRTVDMHVQRLRSKLGDEGEWIETVRGFGYRMRTDPPAR